MYICGYIYTITHVKVRDQLMGVISRVGNKYLYLRRHLAGPAVILLTTTLSYFSQPRFVYMHGYRDQNGVS